MVGVRAGVGAEVPLPRSPVKVWNRSGSAPSARVERSLGTLERAWAAERAARQATQEAVAAAVLGGATWGRVATVLGMSVEGARYRHRVHVASA